MARPICCFTASRYWGCSMALLLREPVMPQSPSRRVYHQQFALCLIFANTSAMIWKSSMIPGGTYAIFSLTNGYCQLVRWPRGIQQHRRHLLWLLLHRPCMSPCFHTAPQLELTSIIHHIDWQQNTPLLSRLPRHLNSLTIGNFRDDTDNDSHSHFSPG